MSPRPERELFEEIAQIMGIDQPFVEKDWYVVQIIRIIASIQHPNFEVVFWGGTACTR